MRIIGGFLVQHFGTVLVTRYLHDTHVLGSEPPNRYGPPDHLR